MPFETSPRQANGVKRAFAFLADRGTRGAGSAWAFGVALLVVVVWGVTGPLFGFSDTWQLVINTGTTIVTFLMVFLLQHSQNKDTRALQLKLNELIAAVEGASNRLIDVEDLTEEELERLHKRYQQLAEEVKERRSRGPLSIDSTPPKPHKRETASDHILHGGDAHDRRSRHAW